MKLKKLEIYGFGKWQQQVFELDEQLTVFYGPNEAGKSTLRAFLMSMLFGFPSKKQAAKQYRNTRAQAHGGKLWLTDTPYGEVILERVYSEKSKMTGELHLTLAETGETLPPEALAQITAQLTPDVYRRFYSFDLEALQQLSTVQENQLNQYFLSLGTTGSETMFQWLNQWEKERQQLFKPRGTKQVLNQSLEQLAQHHRQWQDSLAATDRYTQVKQEEARLLSEEDTLRQQLSQHRETLHELTVHQGLYPSYLEQQTLLAEQANDQPVTVTIRETQLTQTETQLANYRTEAEQLDARIATEEASYQLTDDDKWFRDEADNIKQTIRQLPKIDADMQKSLGLSIQVSEKTDRLNHLKAMMDIAEETRLQRVTNEKVRQSITRMQGEDKGHQEALREAHAAIAQQQQNIAEHQAEIADKEKELLSRDEQRQLEALRRRSQHKHKPHQSLTGAALIIAMMCIVISTLMTNTTYQYGLWAGAVAFVLLAIGNYLYVQRQKAQYEEMSAQQAALTERLIQHQFAERNIVELQKKISYARHRTQDIQTQIQDIEQAQVDLLTEQRQLMKREGLPVQIPFNVLLDKSYGESCDIQDDLDALNEDVLRHEHRLAAWLSGTTYFSDTYLPDLSINPTEAMRTLVSAFRLKVDECQRAEQQHQKTLERIALLKEQRQQVATRHEQAEAQVSEWLADNDVPNVPALHALLERQRVQRERSDRLQLLDQQLGEAQTVLQRYQEGDIETALQATRTQIAETEQQLATVTKALVACQQDIAHIEQDGTPDELEQTYENQRTLTRQQLAEVAKYFFAAKLIEELMNEGKENRLTTVLSDARELFYYLTEERYTRLLFQDDTLQVMRYDERVLSLNELSQGTLEQLYVAIRLAFVKNVSDVAPMPLIIDDAFVNFDAERRNRVYDVLQSFTGKVQIILFSFDDMVAELVSPQHCIQLSVETKETL